MRCPATERVKSGGVDVPCLTLVGSLPTLHSKFATPSQSLIVTPSATPSRLQHFIMVTTRKKDYGSAPPPTRRPPRPPRQRKEPLSEFTLFPRLPLELQLMIWQASMTPRLIVAAPKDLRTRFPHHSRRILPSLFSVNQGSRYCALRHYTIRMTLSRIIDERGKHAKFQSTTHRAKVVSKQLPTKWAIPLLLTYCGLSERYLNKALSSVLRKLTSTAAVCTDDTLGFMGWETLDFEHRTRLEVKDANGSPWTSFPQSTGRVNKVAFLGSNITWNNKMVDSLNSMASCDLGSILHKEPINDDLWKWYPNNETWNILLHRPLNNRRLLIHSRNFNGSLEAWAQRLIHRAKRGTLPLWSGAPDILAFELQKKPKPVYCPFPYIPAPTVHDLYRVLPAFMVERLLDDFYASIDWRWYRRGDRDRRGF